MPYRMIPSFRHRAIEVHYNNNYHALFTVYCNVVFCDDRYDVQCNIMWFDVI